ncbi:MAG: hypothetical protein OXT67_08220 [Zetaproteobacteria bacterium]|nr:hypothetical protein [Zetaproteobacteria bacterium]
MTSLNSRAEESPRKCLDEALGDYAPAATMPTGESLSARLNCQEDLNETSQLAFGVDGDRFYLVEKTGSSASEAIYVLANAKTDSSEVETWEVNYQANPADVGASGPSAGYTHIFASDTSGIEVTTAGTLGGYALSCGIHLKSNDDYIYIKGQLSIGGSCTEQGTYCMNAVSLDEAEMSNCTGASLDSFSLQTLTLDAVTSDASSKTTTITDTKISGFVDFNTDA